MIYLTHPSGAFAACEDADHAAPYEARGYTRCDRAAFRAAWQARDARAFGELRDARPKAVSAPISGGAPPDGVLVRLEGGRALFSGH